MEHMKLIDDLGGPTIVSQELEMKDPQRVSNWRTRGIPWKERLRFANLAFRKGVELPADFFGEQE
tara:strand:- start:3742 stop:3936 length:195 start_codon:yes stop_codon:yes gene_type:complete